MKSLATRLVLAATLVIGVGAAARSGQVAGSGLDSCGGWTAGSREYGPGRRITAGSLPYLRQSEWVLGYLSGVGATGAVTKLDPFNGVDVEGVLAWFDNYCHAHPLDKIEKAASAFITAHPR